MHEVKVVKAKLYKCMIHIKHLSESEFTYCTRTE